MRMPISCVRCCTNRHQAIDADPASSSAKLAKITSRDHVEVVRDVDSLSLAPSTDMRDRQSSARRAQRFLNFLAHEYGSTFVRIVQ